MNKSEKKQIVFFLVVSFLSMIILGIIYGKYKSPDTIVALIFIPAITAIVSRILFKEGTKNLFLRVHFKRNKKTFIKTALIIPAIVYSAAILNYILFKNNTKLLGTVAMYSFQYSGMLEYLKGITRQVSNLALIFPIYGVLQCFCEEFAWRGYLLPKLCKIMPAQKAAMLNGFLWGLWQVPVMTYIYRDIAVNPFVASVMLVIVSMAIGSIQSYFLFRTESLWCPVIFSLSINMMSMYTPAAVFEHAAMGTAASFIFSGGIGTLAIIVFGIYCYKKSRMVYVD